MRSPSTLWHRSRSAIVAILVVASTWAVPAAVHAHADYVSTSPEDGAVLEQSPTEVSVEFDSGLLDAGAAFVVTAADGTVVSIEPAVVGRRSLSVPLPPNLAAGEYQAAFRVVSEDGHTVTDSFTFTVVASRPSSSPADTATPSPTSAATTASDPTPAAEATPTAPAPASPGSSPTSTASAESTGESSGPPVVLLGGAAVLVLVGVAAVLLVTRRRD